MGKCNPFTEAYHLLLDHFGSQHWWPAETPLEVMVGAVLTQNTSWDNVRKAIAELRIHGLLAFEPLSGCSAAEIAPLIRASGYFNLKAQRLRNLLDLIVKEYQSDLKAFLDDDPEQSRSRLLTVKGIGPETADSILLYACNQPVFVVDMYTHRVFSRHNLLPEECDYHTMQDTFVAHLPRETQLYNEFHALIVRVATTYCKKNKPLCGQCPLQGLNL
jgi:endonuclease III related protein